MPYPNGVRSSISNRESEPQNRFTTCPKSQSQLALELELDPLSSPVLRAARRGRVPNGDLGHLPRSDSERLFFSGGLGWIEN